MKNGFTLAEVLVTLGILGVIAAMTLPLVFGKYKKVETVSRLQKVYANLNNALRQAEADYESSKYWDDVSGTEGANMYFDTYLNPYLKVLERCRRNKVKACNYSSVMPWKRLNGDGDEYHVVLENSINARISFILNDGVFVSYIFGSGYDNNDKRVIVDLNGPRLPNKFGIDTFLLVRVPEKGILPFCYNQTDEYINNSCSSSGNGYCCGAKIMKDGWQIKDDYYWK